MLLRTGRLMIFSVIKKVDIFRMTKFNETIGEHIGEPPGQGLGVLDPTLCAKGERRKILKFRTSAKKIRARHCV